MGCRKHEMKQNEQTLQMITQFKVPVFKGQQNTIKDCIFMKIYSCKIKASVESINSMGKNFKKMTLSYVMISGHDLKKLMLDRF